MDSRLWSCNSIKEILEYNDNTLDSSLGAGNYRLQICYNSSYRCYYKRYRCFVSSYIHQYTITTIKLCDESIRTWPFVYNYDVLIHFSNSQRVVASNVLSISPTCLISIITSVLHHFPIVFSTFPPLSLFLNFQYASDINFTTDFMLLSIRMYYDYIYILSLLLFIHLSFIIIILYFSIMVWDISLIITTLLNSFFYMLLSTLLL